ncbi:hypothetical protein [Streptomyces sp. NPDC054958]
MRRTHGERFPALGAAPASAAEHGGQDQALEFGPARVLDGLELLMTRRATGDRHHARPEPSGPVPARPDPDGTA